MQQKTLETWYSRHSDQAFTFIETMLFESGVIPRRGSVENHNTISDFTDLEHEREIPYSHLMHVKNGTTTKSTSLTLVLMIL